MSEKPAGTILDQDPGANSLVSSSGTIRVTVSSGPADEVLMPDLTNVPLQSALSQLNGLGEFDIDFTSRTDYDDHIPKDSVISTIPAKDQPLTEGTKIYLTISLGKEEETVPMIDLRGMTQEQAEKAIVGLGLTVGTVDHSSSDMPAGRGLVPVRGAQGRGSPGDQGEYHHQHRFCRGKPTELQDDHL